MDAAPARTRTIADHRAAQHRQCSFSDIDTPAAAIISWCLMAGDCTVVGDAAIDNRQSGSAKIDPSARRIDIEYGSGPGRADSLVPLHNAARYFQITGTADAAALVIHHRAIGQSDSTETGPPAFNGQDAKKREPRPRVGP